MNTQKSYLILAAVTVVFFSSALAEVEPLRFNERGLIGEVNPALAGIKELYIKLHLDTHISHVDIATLQNLHKRVESKLVEAGIRIYPRPFLDSRPKPFGMPELRIDIGTLKLEDFQQCVFRIQTSLAKEVYLSKDFLRHIKADVWKTEPAMQAVPTKEMPDKVAGVMLEQVEAFTCAYLAANQSEAEPADVKEVATEPQELRKPAEKTQQIKYKFVASKNSKVFHKPDCSWASRIKPENLETFQTRDEAIKAGKRPCKQCKP